MNKQITPNNTTLVGQLAEITHRKCKSSIQPHVKLGVTYIIVGEDTLANGHKVIIVGNPDNKDKTIRINADRFTWHIISPAEFNEKMFKKKCNESATQLDKLSKQEQVKVCFTPLIINEIAWHYAYKALQEAVKNKIGLLKKLSRTVRTVRDEYYRTLSIDLDQKHIRTIESRTLELMNELSRQFQILYFCVNNEFKKKCPNFPYDELRTYALLSVLFIKFLDTYNEKIDKKLRTLFGPRCGSTHKLKEMDKLYSLMLAMAGEDERFDFADGNIKMSMRIIEIELELELDKIQFTIA